MDKLDKKEKEKELQRMVSLTFDENPEVRRNAAISLAESSEPAALFALIELSYDKDPNVKATVAGILSKKQSSGDKNAISFADLFNQSEPEKAQIQETVQPTPEEDLRKKQLLSPIEQIFEKKLGKSKAAIVKDKMMATIEKIYMRAVGTKTEDAHKREKSMQKMLTSYADVLSAGLDSIAADPRTERETRLADVQTVDSEAKTQYEEPGAAQPDQTAQVQEDVSEVLDEVGLKVDNSKISQDLSAISDDSEDEQESSAQKPDEDGRMLDRSTFRKAYEMMMAAEGDEEAMFQQSQRISKQLQDEVAFAFRMAKQRFKAEHIAHLTMLRDGMRNVTTDVLNVKTAEMGEYMRTKTKKDSYVRITVNDDEGSEGIIYLFEGRGSEVRAGMKVKVVRGQVKSFKFSGETAITVGRKGNVYIVL